MTQPELGKKLIALRQSKGMTQNDLSEKCNVNVRTIQRIELGQVEPRPVTLKILLEALDEQFETFMHQEIDSRNTDSHLRPDQKVNLQLAWVAGLIYFITGFPEVYMDMTLINDDFSTTEMLFYGLLKVAVVISFGFFIKGFIDIARFYGNELLVYASYALIGVVTVFYTAWFVGIYFNWDIVEIAVVESVVTGVCYVVFGALLFQLGKDMQPLAKVVAVLDVLTGVMLATVILAPLGLILLVPNTLLKSYLLYSISNHEMELNLG